MKFTEVTRKKIFPYAQRKMLITEFMELNGHDGSENKDKRR